jgi:hypothetical protein
MWLRPHPLLWFYTDVALCHFSKGSNWTQNSFCLKLRESSLSELCLVKMLMRAWCYSYSVELMQQSLGVTFFCCKQEKLHLASLLCTCIPLNILFKPQATHAPQKRWKKAAASRQALTDYFLGSRHTWQRRMSCCLLSAVCQGCITIPIWQMALLGYHKWLPYAVRTNGLQSGCHSICSFHAPCCATQPPLWGKQFASLPAKAHWPVCSWS